MPVAIEPVRPAPIPEMPPPGYVIRRTPAELDILCEDNFRPWKRPGQKMGPCRDNLCRIPRDYQRQKR